MGKGDAEFAQNSLQQTLQLRRGSNQVQEHRLEGGLHQIRRQQQRDPPQDEQPYRHNAQQHVEGDAGGEQEEVLSRKALVQRLQEVPHGGKPWGSSTPLHCCSVGRSTRKQLPCPG
jgi:hypothetical protein